MRRKITNAPQHQVALSAICLLINALNALIAILTARGFNIPPEIIYVLAPINVGLPLLVIAVGAYFAFKEPKGAAALRKEQKAVEQELEDEKNGKQLKKKKPLTEQQKARMELLQVG